MTYQVRDYYVWIKGRRASTETVITTAEGRLGAIWEYAKRYGRKTIECDAQWIKPSRLKAR